MKRRLTIEVEVGDAAPDECGACPFLCEQTDFVGPTGKHVCSAPTFGFREKEADGKRHEMCLASETPKSEGI